MLIRLTLGLIAVFVVNSEAYALSLVDSGFDQIAAMNSLGGSVTQMGGNSPGSTLLNAADFDGAVGTSTGILADLPGWVGASGFSSFSDGGSLEPGNTATNLLATPTDASFTFPDSASGDGSVELLAGGSVTLSFGSLITAPLVLGVSDGPGPDLFLVTDTSGVGTARIELLANGGVVDTMDFAIPNGSAGTGMGGVLLATAVSFDAVRFSVLTGKVELDAVLARSDDIPEPTRLLLLSALLAGLILRRPAARLLQR